MSSTDHRLGRRRFIAAGTLGLASAATGAIPARAAIAASATVPVVAPSGDTSGATDASSILATLQSRGWVQLVEGTYWVNRTLLLDDGRQLLGAGRGLTVVRLAAGANTDVVANADQSNGTTAPAVRHLTIDGNRGQQSVANNRHGINFTLTASAEIESVEVHDCATPRGVAAVALNGSGNTAFSRRNRVAGLWVHDCSGEGFKLTSGNRESMLSDIRAWSNGDHGVQLDASECVARGIYAWGNGGDGIYITNVFGAAYSDLHASVNNRHGIEVYGLVSSTGTNWVAHDNSQGGPGSYNDLHFADDGRNTYGVSDALVVTGVSVGAEGLYNAPGTERYAVFAEDGVTGSVVVAGIAFSGPGKSGRLRRPATPGSRFRVEPSGADRSIKSGPVTVSGASETTLVQQKVIGGLLGPLGDLRCTIVGDLLNATSTPHTVTLRVYAGPHGGALAKIYDGTTGPIQAAPSRRKLALSMVFANRNEAANALTVQGGIGNPDAPTTGIGTIADAATGTGSVAQLFGSAQVAVDTRVDWDFQVTVQLDASSASLDLRMDKSALEVLP